MIICSILACVILLGVFSLTRKSSSIIQAKVADASVQTAEQTAGKLKLMLKNYEKQSLQFITDTDLWDFWERWQRQTTISKSSIPLVNFGQDEPGRNVGFVRLLRSRLFRLKRVRRDSPRVNIANVEAIIDSPYAQKIRERMAGRSGMRQCQMAWTAASWSRHSRSAAC